MEETTVNAGGEQLLTPVPVESTGMLAPPAAEKRSISYFVDPSIIAVDLEFNGRLGDEDPKALQALAADIAKNGQIQDGTVIELPETISGSGPYDDVLRRARQNNPGAKWFLISGHRRFAAVRRIIAQKLVPDFPGFRVRKLDKSLKDARDWNITENSTHKPLTAHQKASLVLRMRDLEQRDVADIARVFGKTAAWVSQMSALQSLCPECWTALEIEAINLAQAQAYAKLPEVEQVKALREGLTAKAAKDLASVLAAGKAEGGEDGEGPKESKPRVKGSGGGSGDKPSKQFRFLVASYTAAWRRERKESGNKQHPKPIELALLAQVDAWFAGGLTSADMIENIGRIVNGTGTYKGLARPGAMPKVTKEDRDAAAADLVGSEKSIAAAAKAETPEDETGDEANE